MDSPEFLKIYTQNTAIKRGEKNSEFSIFPLSLLLPASYTTPTVLRGWEIGGCKIYYLLQKLQGIFQREWVVNLSWFDFGLKMNIFSWIFVFLPLLIDFGRFGKVLLVNLCSFISKTFPRSIFGENGENFIYKTICIL